MPDIDLDLIEKLDQQATPGPWRDSQEPPPVRNGYFDSHCIDDSIPVESRGTQFALGVAVGVTSRPCDAALIAYYRTACPKLAREVRRLRQENERLDEELQQCDEAAGYDGNREGLPAVIRRLRAQLESAERVVEAARMANEHLRRCLHEIECQEDHDMAGVECPKAEADRHFRELRQRLRAHDAQAKERE